MQPQQLKISGKQVSLHLPSLKKHIRAFKIVFRSKLQELCGGCTPPVDRGQNIQAAPPYMAESLITTPFFLTVSDAELGYPEI
jgi:hypothetical protein